MEIGVFSRTYETGDLRDTFTRMRRDGMTHTQFNFSNAGLPTLPETIAEGDIVRIRETAEEFGITIDAVTGTFNMIDPDEDARARGCAQFSVQCRAARELGIPVVSLCTGSKNLQSKWKWHDDNLLDSSWDDLMRSTEIVLRHAEDNGIVLGVETEASNIINTPARARRYLDTFKSPHLKIIMDGANLFRPAEVPEMERILREAFEILGKDIVLAHAKDFAYAAAPAGSGAGAGASAQPAQLDFVAAGRGVLDFPLYVRLLKESGYKGALIMHGLSEAQIPESLAFLKKLA